MAGLETIALAVAHLESLQSDVDLEVPEPTKIISESDKGQSCKSFPYPRLHGRMVSDDSINQANINNQNSCADDPSTNAQSLHDPRLYQQWYASGSYLSPPLQHTVDSKPTSTSAALDTSNQDCQTKAESSGPGANLLQQVSMVSDNLEKFFSLMDELEQLALPEGTKPAEIPKSDEPIAPVQRFDVLLGRGGETNHHVGNIQYRQLVKACQPAYLAAKRRDKPRIAAAIVGVVRARSGRFLKKHAVDNSWRDVGSNRAREKTSQALREGAPELRGTSESTRSQLLTEAVEGKRVMKLPTNMSDEHTFPNKMHLPPNGSDPQVGPFLHDAQANPLHDPSSHGTQSTLIQPNGHHHYPRHLPIPFPIANGHLYFPHPQGMMVFPNGPVAVDGRYHHIYPDKRPMTSLSTSQPPQKRQFMTPPPIQSDDVPSSQSEDSTSDKRALPVTVSAEQSEEEPVPVRTASPASSTCSSSKNITSRGPRLKLLKQRFEDMSSQA